MLLYLVILEYITFFFKKKKDSWHDEYQEYQPNTLEML